MSDFIVYTGVVKSRNVVQESEFKLNIASLSFIDQDKLDELNFKNIPPEKHFINKGDIVVRVRHPFVSRFVDAETKNTIYDSLLFKIDYNKENIEGKYLSYLINTDKFQDMLFKLSTSPKKENGIRTIKAENFKKILSFISLPPIETQREHIKKINELEATIRIKENEIENVFSKDLMFIAEEDINSILEGKDEKEMLKIENELLKERIKQLENFNAQCEVDQNKNQSNNVDMS